MTEQEVLLIKSPNALNYNLYEICSLMKATAEMVMHFFLCDHHEIYFSKLELKLTKLASMSAFILILFLFLDSP